MSGKVKAPRKAPTQERSKATVQFILEATRRVIAQNGVAKVTVNEVAAAAGVSVASLYQYFPTREAVLAACEEQSLSLLSSTFSERAIALHQARAPLEQAIPELVLLGLELFTAHAQVFGTIDEAVPASRVEVRQPLVDAAAELLASMLEERAADDARLRGKDLRRESLIALETVVSFGYTQWITRQSIAQRGYQRDVAQMITRYLLGTSSP